MHSISIQLKAIRVFLEASSGECFISCFLNHDGHVCLGDILHSSLSTKDDKLEAMQTLIIITGISEHNKILISDKLYLNQRM